jgi:hypothetical protein
MRPGDHNEVRALLPELRRYGVRPNRLHGPPARLSRLCRIFGFRNPCDRGHVFLTDSKIEALEQLGLAAPLDEEPPQDAGPENDGALGAHKLKPPTEGLVGFDRMPIRERAFAVLLALKYGYRVLSDDWTFHPVTGEVVVTVPGQVTIWSTARGTIEEVLDELGRRGWRTDAEEIING